MRLQGAVEYSFCERLQCNKHTEALSAQEAHLLSKACLITVLV